ncbi:fibronectin type III domain-containing protein [Geomonas nitrogeniifigens]|uniref:Fibronectin type III domain-containing protein n=1 Tax=Geomonas diazotrophica TaxID=2843197 RepID=A0ABX8JFP0_9BACT|nr:fibronectin type III domain-containing protein [Geomonas nitrogeniifigens]QWV97208.1 fibronectin type III domain-containing protein [Geomonas nitrogeniifigens]QXE86379.1 fibronectin type III domain-containing protein [Geomonas nitrogeniifigens]
MSEPFDIPGLRDLSDGDLALQGEAVADLLDEHAAFKDQTLPACIPGPTQIRQDAHQVKQTSTAARLDPSKEPARQAAREKMIQSIKFSCQYVVMYSTHTNNPYLLDTVGVNRVHKAPRSTVIKLPQKFNKVKISHGDKSGAVKIYVNSWEGKGSVVVQVCYGDPSLEESWQQLKMSHYCHFTVEGLEPARRAYFRVRLMNDAGVGPWSEVMELIII